MALDFASLIPVGGSVDPGNLGAALDILAALAGAAGDAVPQLASAATKGPPRCLAAALRIALGFVGASPRAVPRPSPAGALLHPSPVRHRRWRSSHPAFALAPRPGRPAKLV
ncbi:MAG: hypothetical protein IT509_08405 [Rhodocyclaceae bacterium]|nr:hypothetical protein [Rhodocyclaceae bacterium]